MTLRLLHAGAWWAWALALAVAASRTTDPLLLTLLVGVAALVVAARADDPGRRAFRFYLLLAGVVVLIRLVVRAVFGGGAGGAVLFELPQVPTPEWAVGLRIGGPVSVDEMRAALYDGLRLATILVAVGAANGLADARRLLKSLPRGLYDLGTAVVIGVTLAPQLAASAGRVRRAQHLRSSPPGRRRLIRRLVMPVMDDALTRSIRMGTAMEVRGFGRSVRRVNNPVFATLVVGVVGVGLGLYGVLDATTPPVVGAPALATGFVLTALGIRRAGSSREITVYRRDPWSRPEWLVTASGLICAAVFVWLSVVDPVLMHPRWLPDPPIAAVMATLVAATPVWSAPTRPPTRGDTARTAAEVGT